MAFSAPADPRQIMTPTKLNRLARTILQSEIGLVWLSAEISNFVRASSGHWYFTLKDERAQVRAAMFKQANRYIKPLPKEGDKVLVRASVGLYEPRGDYQLIVEHLEAEGAGQLKLAFEQLKIKLNNEGLFSTDRKRPLPAIIKRLGVITSPSGAALHDVLTVLRRRSPSTEVIVYPSLVQGEMAAENIRAALSTANQRKEVDALLITRGGGSIEDLWCFNDERLARDIVQSELVIVSAVGHEVDVTISDFVADLRAPTPSAAAELLSQDLSVKRNQVAIQSDRLRKQMALYFNHAKQRQKHAYAQLVLLHPTKQLQQHAQRLDMLSIRLQNAALTQLNRSSAKTKHLLHQFSRIKLQAQIKHLQQHIARLNKSQHRAWNSILNDKTQRLQKAAAHLQAISPLATLARGYSITMQNDKAVASVADVDSSRPLVTKLEDGEIISLPEKVIARG
ncbi:exodeoxyribonuclease VII large subunit [Alteromonas sediminis]|uniref:Exodeoxyribonuclease 7 large subunit n=1 Tax=Alteromonas sediminis TaxID=2259342 RepID=A0A3N5XXT1_9ALTE|nr:exodeoxyribonuclease VII large subunit [Alteromonas sediminis]RPJ65652.1 exodeoxyribonuclease VII large subunit [Alteromonas sediminis]